MTMNLFKLSAGPSATIALLLSISIASAADKTLRYEAQPGGKVKIDGRRASASDLVRAGNVVEIESAKADTKKLRPMVTLRTIGR